MFWLGGFLRSALSDVSEDVPQSSLLFPSHKYLLCAKRALSYRDTVVNKIEKTQFLHSRPVLNTDKLTISFDKS